MRRIMLTSLLVLMKNGKGAEKMKNFIRVLSIVLLSGVFIFSMNLQVLAADKVLRIASITPVGTHHDDFCRYFAKKVTEAKVGLKVQVISGTPLGNAPQTIDQVIKGTPAMVGNDMAWIAPFDDDFKILNWGYAFRGPEHQKQFFASPLFGEIVERIRTKHGLRVLAALPAQARLIFSKKPIRKIEDVKGLKIRVPQIKVWVETWRNFGATPTPLSFHEVYMALNTGVIEAAGGQASPSYSYNYHKAAKYIMDLGHIIPASFIAINDKVFQSLTPEQQKVVAEEAKKTMQWAFEDAMTNANKSIQKMVAEGAEVVTVDKTGFMQAAAKAAPKLEAEGTWSKGLFAKIQAIK